MEIKKKLIQENKVLKQEVENLHKEIDSLNSKYENIRKIRANENTAASFCNWSYINYYFRDDFEEKLPFNFDKNITIMCKITAASNE